MDIEAGVATVATADPALGALIRRAGPFEPRSADGDYFGSLARAIVYQQLAGRAAAAIHARLVNLLGGRVTPEGVLAASTESLRGVGLSANKAMSITDLSTKATDGTVPLAQLNELDDEDIISRLSTVRGVGRWTAEMFLMFELQRPDVWPVDDFGVRNGWTLIHSLPAMVKPKELQAEGERFRPYRSIAAWYCWRAVALHRGDMVLPGAAE